MRYLVLKIIGSDENYQWLVASVNRDRGMKTLEVIDYFETEDQARACAHRLMFPGD